jgi:PAS domain-containing protein
MVAESQAVFNKFLNSVADDDRFYRDGQNENSRYFGTLIQNIKDTLNKIVTHEKVFSNKIDPADVDTLFNSLDLYANNFAQIVLSLDELGNKDHGRIHAFLESSEQLSNAIQKVDLIELSDFSVKLGTLEKLLITGRDFTTYDEIVSLIDNLDYLPEMEELDFMVREQITGMLQIYKTRIAELRDSYSRLDQNAISGLYSKFNAGYHNVLKNYVSFKTASDTLIGRQYRISLIIILIGILILSLLFTAYILRILALIATPLREALEFSYNLAKGKLNLKSLGTEYPKEFSTLNLNLNKIFHSVEEKKNFVDDLLKQKFKADLTLQGKNDTFGKTLIALKENMRKARDEQNKYSEENKLRRYQNEGIAKFSDILRNNSDNLDKLADIFIREVVKYFEAIQGGLFLQDEKDKELLHLKAAFAYNRKKYLTKQIRTGEGLVGTCALEKKTINLSEIPEDYIEITSGLGDAPPDNLLLLPVMHEDVLIGVLEMASLTQFDQNQISLGEKITESLASSIINARANSRTSELLQKSQQQAAEMAEQEEEMRQNMEELKATQEESARREEELEGILNAIDQSFYVLEYDIEGTITKVNQRFLYLVNLKHEEVLGKKHKQIFGKKSKADSLLFASVAEGKTVELAEKVEIDKKILEIKNTFSAVKAKGGETLNILNIMSVKM